MEVVGAGRVPVGPARAGTSLAWSSRRSLHAVGDCGVIPATAPPEAAAGLLEGRWSPDG